MAIAVVAGGGFVKRWLNGEDPDKEEGPEENRGEAQEKTRPRCHPYFWYCEPDKQSTNWTDKTYELTEVQEKYYTYIYAIYINLYKQKNKDINKKNIVFTDGRVLKLLIWHILCLEWTV